ncbi:MAG: hypothetical protein SF066_07520 [Thermoanaerobaculia bacterium]|nr:hypothetical protein [Thermoanaerobaculia bacterium]
MLLCHIVLPGIAFLGFVVAATAVLERWFEVVPRRFVLLAVVLILVRFGPELFAGRVALPLHEGRLSGYHNGMQSDLLTEVAPLRQVVVSEFAAGRWPLWNAGFGLGMGLLGDPQAQVLEPTTVVAVPFGVPAGLPLTWSLRLFLAFVFTFCLGRRLGLGEHGAALAAYGFAFGGYLFLWLGWPLSAVATWTPALLYALLVALERGARRDLALLAGAAASLVMAGHPETILYSVVGASAFTWVAVRSVRPTAGRFLRIILAGALGVLLVAPAWLAMADLLPQSVRHKILADRNRRYSQGAVDCRSDFVAIAVPLALPRFFGTDRDGTARIPPIADRPGSGFPGTLPWLLAVGLLLTAPGRWRRWEVFFLSAALIALLLMVKPAAWSQWLVQVPILSSLPTIWGRCSLWFYLSLALAAGFGLERFLRAPEAARRTRWLALAAAVALAATAALLASLVPADRISLGVQAVVAGIGAWALGLGSGRLRPAVLVTVTAAELFFHFGGDFSRRAQEFAHYQPRSVAPLARLTAEVPQPVRIVSLSEELVSNVAAQIGFDDLGVSGPARPWASNALTRPINPEPWRTADHFIRPEHPLYRWLGVRFVVTGPRVHLGPPYRQRYRRHHGRIYERTDALPLVFVPRDARFESPLEVRLPLEDASSPAQAVPARRLEPDHWRVDLPAEGGRLVASSIYDDGHWHRLIDDAPAAPIVAEKTLVAALAPAGAHTIDLLYRPRPVVLGAALAAFGLAILTALTSRRA